MTLKGYYALCLTPPLQRTPANIRINLMSPETRVIGLHFCADSMGLSSFIFYGELRKMHLLWNRMRIGRSRSSIGRWLWHQSKGVCMCILQLCACSRSLVTSFGLLIPTISHVVVIAVFGPSHWKCITGGNGAKIRKIGESGFWPLTKMVLLFGPKAIVQNFINVE